MRDRLESAFELVDGLLWRKEIVDTLGRRYPRKLVENVANNGDGYCKVRFKGGLISYHRIIWVLLNGDVPEGTQIDHIDGNRVNNSIDNLRLVTNRENSQNRVRHRKGRLVGCSYHKLTNKWRAYTVIGSKQRHLGLFNTEQEAHEAYLVAAEGLRYA